MSKLCLEAMEKYQAFLATTSSTFQGQQLEQKAEIKHDAICPTFPVELCGAVLKALGKL